MAKLTAKQKRFVEEYLIDLNATQAAIRAGYKVDNARIIAAENLSKLNIAEAIDKALAERSRRTGIELFKNLPKLLLSILRMLSILIVKFFPMLMKLILRRLNR